MIKTCNALSAIQLQNYDLFFLSNISAKQWLKRTIFFEKTELKIPSFNFPPLTTPYTDNRIMCSSRNPPFYQFH